ncbi:MAG: protein-L-isoaspartate(D-aspartate) O-methyltransferase [Proteobacteria bacterium]|nr:MAG: protein-L-isoaspartate(D-aspartate) O-methyltransferase [Pseudomonadota bacterium]
MPSSKETRHHERDLLIGEIVAEVRDTSNYTGRTALHATTLDALRRVDRADFVDDDNTPRAYINSPLGIGYGQTISQPYIVALMTDLLDLDADSRVLEVGTGSGYQAAVLAEIAAQVYTVEIVPELATSARETLTRLGYSNIHAKAGNGRLGWSEHGPYDAVIVTAAADDIPRALIDQLAPGGVLVIPLNTSRHAQSLKRIHKNDDGGIDEEDVLPVVFVPLTGDR